MIGIVLKIIVNKAKQIQLVVMQLFYSFLNVYIYYIHVNKFYLNRSLFDKIKLKNI